MTWMVNPAEQAGNAAEATTTGTPLPGKIFQSDGSSVFASDVIQLHVGPEQKVYTAHKAVLTRVPFFQTCLSKNFVEGITNVVKLPEEVVTAVEYVLHYAYFASLPETGVLPDNEVDMINFASALERTYILADKWCMEDLGNKLTDRFRSHFREWKVQPHRISVLRNYGLVDSQLRCLMLQHLAYRLRKVGWDKYVHGHAEWGAALLEYCRKGGEDVVNLMRSYADRKNLSSPALADNPCDWHKHGSTPPCTPP